jgi:hypothetical protein
VIVEFKNSAPDFVNGRRPLGEVDSPENFANPADTPVPMGSERSEEAPVSVG